jgi:hypothetical protein
MPMLIVIWDNPNAASELEKFEAEGLGSNVFLIPSDKEGAFKRKWQSGGAEPQDLIVLRVTDMDAYYLRMSSGGADRLLEKTFKNIKAFKFDGSL